jgi:chromosomal replication initiation ATPase DnaA
VAGVVAELYDTTPARMRAGDRHALVLWPRQVTMFCQLQLMPEAFQALAAWWGLSKTAVLHSVARVCALRDTEERTRAEICQVLAAVKIRIADGQRHQGATPAVRNKITTTTAKY